MIWNPSSLSVGKPAYIALADLIADRIGNGDLIPGARLPTVRVLAGLLRIAPATCLRGYAEAQARGLIIGGVGRGTFVRELGDLNPHARAQFAVRGFAAAGIYDLRSNVVPGPSEWDTDEGLEALLPSPRVRRDILATAYTLADSTEPPSLRHAGADWARRCGVDAAPKSILIAAGGQHAIAAALCAIRRDDAPLAVPETTNSGVLAAARLFGIPLVPVRIDREGIDPVHLELVFRKSRPCGFYCAPAGGNPIPTLLSLERRLAIARVTEHFGAWIVEDDAPGLLVDRQHPPIAALAPHRTLWLASVAQSLGFGFRLGFARVPGDMERGMQEALRVLAWTGATPGALLMAEGLRSKIVDTVLMARRQAIARRHAIVAETLRSKNCVMQSGIPYIWFETPSGWRPGAFHTALLANGVSTAPATQFAVDEGRVKRGVRLSSAPHLSPDHYADALKRVAAIAAQPSRYKAC